MQNRKNVPKKAIFAKMGLPCEIQPQMPQILLLGQGHLRAQPCLRLLCYSETEITAQIGKLRLCVRGEALRIEVFCARTLELCGKIQGVFWQMKGEEVQK